MLKRPRLLLLLLLVGGVSGLTLLAGGLGERAVHLLPHGYVGRVVIVYHAPAGGPAEYDDQNRRVYRVPPNGVVLTTLAPDPAMRGSDVAFYEVDGQGERREIPKSWSSDDPDAQKRERRIFAGGAGQTDLYDINCRIINEYYYVGTLEDLNSDKGKIDIEQYFRSNPELCPPLNR